MRIAFGRFARVSMGIKSRRRAFTLVEMLVVMGIIVVLISILMPVLSRVREAGKRSKCAANLHSIGQSCLAFANDHNGIFPVAYRMLDQPVTSTPPTTVYPFRIPNFIPYPNPNTAIPANPILEHDNDNNPLTGWQSTGTSWQMFMQYNCNLAIFSCPDASTQAQAIDYSATNPTYGSVVDTNYMYLGGLSDNADIVNNSLGHGSMSPQRTWAASHFSRSHWGTTPPATLTLGSPVYALQSSNGVVIPVSLGYARPASCILAADMVYFSGMSYGRVYRINHPQWTNNNQPDFQNVLYADGRVDGLGRDSYAQPLYDNSGVDPTGSGAAISPLQYNYSLQFADNAGGFYYWGEGSATPMPDLSINTNDVYQSGPPASQWQQPTNMVAPPPPTGVTVITVLTGEGNPPTMAP